MPIDIFQIIPELRDERIHPKVKLLRDNPMLAGEKGILTDWVEGLVDRDNKIVKEFQTTFHSSFWEFYLFGLFKDLNFSMDQSYERPDFMITKPYEINVEAVVSNIKYKGRSEEDRNYNDFISMTYPLVKEAFFNEFIDEAIVRHSTAILSKNNKFLNEYSKCTWIKPDTPFIIALGSYDQVNYGREFYYPMMALLYGAYYNPIKDTFEVKKRMLKTGTNSPIELGLFQNPKYQNISAIIFSCVLTLGKLTSLSISQNNAEYDYQYVMNIRHDFEQERYLVQIVSKENPEDVTAHGD